MTFRGFGEGLGTFRWERRADMHRDDEAPLLPKFDYHLDGSDPDLLVLRRQDDAFVAAFSARGATKEGVLEAAQDDYRALIREHAGPLGLESGAIRSRSA
jgi:hypothetical protein